MRVRDVVFDERRPRPLVFRLKLDARWIAHPIPDDRSPDKPKNFAYALYGVDAGIADVLRVLNCHGYPTMTSMSGLLADYPDSKEGAEFGYIMFFKLEPRVEKHILRVARSCGLEMETERGLGWARGVTVRTGVLVNGMRKSELLAIARREAKQAGVGINWEFFEKRMDELAKQYGGYVDDEGVKELWRCFTERLTGEAAQQF